MVPAVWLAALSGTDLKVLLPLSQERREVSSGHEANQLTAQIPHYYCGICNKNTATAAVFVAFSMTFS